MTITKLFTVFEIFDTEDEAVASFEKVPEGTTEPLDEHIANRAANGGTSVL
jgi:hypothetical protein